MSSAYASRVSFIDASDGRVLGEGFAILYYGLKSGNLIALSRDLGGIAETHFKMCQKMPEVDRSLAFRDSPLSTLQEEGFVVVLEPIDEGDRRDVRADLADLIYGIAS